MILSMKEQGLIFLFICAVGFSSGAVYDIFRIFRRIIGHISPICYIEDFLFWVLASFFVLGTLITINYGELRAYMLIGYFGGMILYFTFLSDIIVGGILRFFHAVSGILRKISDIVIRPLRFVLRPISKAVNLIKLLLKKKAECGIMKVRKAVRSAKEKFTWKRKGKQ